MSVEVGGGSTGDDRMVKALRDAGQHVFAHLYESYAARLFDYCEGILGDEMAATDAVQDSLVAVNARIGPLPDPDPLRVALYSEARRQCLTKLPRRSTRSRRGAGAATAAGPVTQQASVAGTWALTADPEARIVPAAGAHVPGAVPDDAEARMVATAALGMLSDRDREVLSLAFRHGIAGADLAAVLGVPGRRAQSMLSAAGTRFRKAATDAAARRGGTAADRDLGPEMLAAVPLVTPPLTLGLRMTRTALALGSYRRIAVRPAGAPRENLIPVRPGRRRALPHAMAVSTLGLVIIAVPGALIYQLVWAGGGRTPLAAQMAGNQSPASAVPSLTSLALDPGGSVRQHRQGPFPGVFGPPALGVLPVPSPRHSGPPTPAPPRTTSPGPVPSHSTTPPRTTPPPPTTPPPTTPPPTTPPPTTPPPTTPPPTTPPPTTPPPTTPPPTTPPPTTPPPTPSPTG